MSFSPHARTPFGFAVSRRLRRVRVPLAFALAALVLVGLGVAAAPAAAATSAELMRNRPFAPADRGLLAHAVYPETPADAPATGTALTEQQARAALKAGDVVGPAGSLNRLAKPPGADASANAASVKKCKTFKLKKVRHGKVVRRNGRVIFVRVRKCTTVPSKKCTVRWSKKTRNGKAVIRNHNPVWIPKKKCPSAGGDARAVANRILALDPRKPAEINLFTSVFPFGTQGFYPQGSTMIPAPGPELSEAQARSQLNTYLKEQFDNDGAKVKAALALFDSQQAKTMIPTPTLRAAFVGMRGTLLEPTINRFLNGGGFDPVYGYAVIPSEGFIAFTSGGATRSIRFNKKYLGEDFRYLIGIMGHEVLHDDAPLSHSEEAINNSLSAMTYLQVLIKHPELAHTGTELSRQMNDLALVFLNTRESGSPNSEIYAPTGTGVAPGSPRNVPDIWTVLGGDSNTSPAPAALGQILTSLGLPTASQFSKATAETFEGLNDNWLTDKQRLQVAVLLRMVSVAEISQRTGLSQQEAIDLLGLRPYLDAIN